MTPGAGGRRSRSDIFSRHELDPPRPSALTMAPGPLVRLRRLCLALPEAHEVEAWGEPTFRVRNKLFAMFASANNHHGGGRDAVWCKAAPGNQQLMVKAAPAKFFAPPYVGPSGWIGIWLDERTDWAEVAALIEDSYRLIAPKKLLATLDGAAAPARRNSPARRRVGKKASTPE